MWVCANANISRMFLQNGILFNRPFQFKNVIKRPLQPMDKAWLISPSEEPISIRLTRQRC